MNDLKRRQQEESDNEIQALDDDSSQIYDGEMNHVKHNPIGEEIRLSAYSVKQWTQDEQFSKEMGAQIRNSKLNEQNQFNSDGSPDKNQDLIGNPSQQPRSRAKNPNIFGRARSGSKTRDSFKSEGQDSTQKRARIEKLEREFEKKCLRLLQVEDWNSLDQIASQHLEDTKCESFKGFFYLGVSFYKVGEYENAVRAFQKAEQINSEDAQLQYNLGLANFKLEQYNQAVDNLKKCTKLDPQHPYAYNNLAFLYNMHQFYSETIQVCGCAKMNNPQNHNCHRHWAFALFKKGEMAKAIKKIKKGIQKNPSDADNWIIWGLILRTVGNYASAKHKFKKALKIDKDNETARQELQIVEKIMELDEKIPLESVPSLKKNINIKKSINDNERNDGCTRSCNTDNFCIIY